MFSRVSVTTRMLIPRHALTRHTTGHCGFTSRPSQQYTHVLVYPPKPQSIVESSWQCIPSKTLQLCQLMTFVSSLKSIDPSTDQSSANEVALSQPILHLVHLAESLAAIWKLVESN
ncbi:uncharacterized protein [Fopius arisanus]|uniref:Uncharacterized protein n=1 Tax=Fopius arisanus TaxID=64838 RepID=A0A9R1TJB8_9HYME|nr:PREDICTED: uncharacterized protein LOC105270822 [Fopius arisanus]